MIDKTANIVSAIMSPLWIPTMAILTVLCTSYLAVLPLPGRLIVGGVVLATTGLIPLAALIAMKRVGLIGNLDVTDRTERWAPYAVSEVCYLACAFFLAKASMPGIVVNMMIGGALALLVQVIVTRWWKISAHAAGTGALVAMLFREGTSMMTVTNLLPYLLIAILLAGLTGTSRLVLERHTLMQVLVGWFNGFACVWLMTM